METSSTFPAGIAFKVMISGFKFVQIFLRYSLKIYAETENSLEVPWGFLEQTQNSEDWKPTSLPQKPHFETFPSGERKRKEVYL